MARAHRAPGRQQRRTFGLAPERHAPGASSLSRSQVAALEAAQRGLCALCRRELTATRVVDHDHELALLHGHAPDSACARCVRGLLCRRCNSVLGWGFESLEYFERVVAYLSRLSRPPEGPRATLGNTCTCPNGPMPGHYVGCPLAGAFGIPRP